MTFYNKTFILIVSCFFVINICVAQQPPSFSSAIERQFNKIQSDILLTAEEMPEDKFYKIDSNALLLVGKITQGAFM